MAWTSDENIYTVNTTGQADWPRMSLSEGSGRTEPLTSLSVHLQYKSQLVDERPLKSELRLKLTVVKVESRGTECSKNPLSHYYY